MEQSPEAGRILKSLYASLTDALQLTDMTSVFSDELLSSTEKNTRALEELETYLTKVSENSSKISEHLDSFNEMIRTAATRALENSTGIQEAVTALMNMNNMFASLRIIFERLESTIQNISQRTSVIEDIAELTNLLALNAAIEAARAGKEGRGFAVVAKEIRKLADRSKSNADEISTVLTDLRKTMDESSGVFDDYNLTREKLTSDVDHVATNIDSIKDLYTRVQNDIHSVQKITSGYLDETAQAADSIHTITAGFEYTDASAPYILATISRNSDIVKASREAVDHTLQQFQQTSRDNTVEQQDGLLRIGHDVTYPPWVYLDKGESSGISINFTSELCSHMEKAYDFHGDQWFRVFPLLLSGGLDMIINVGWPNSVFDDKPVIVSNPYGQFKIRIFTHKNRLSGGEMPLDYYHGKRIAVQEGSFADVEIRKYGCEAVYVENDQFGMIQHIWNKVDGIATEEKVGSFLSKRFFNDDIVPASSVLATLDVVYMFRDTDEDLRDTVNHVLEEQGKTAS
ncbi:MAG: transporter substrate-binding domain-containing protein [Spirochaetales bacterium]|nr:transporter substrate-binding domain-containing protein [Spirochaetales bacterium]